MSGSTLLAASDIQSWFETRPRKTMVEIDKKEHVEKQNGAKDSATALPRDASSIPGRVKPKSLKIGIHSLSVYGRHQQVAANLKIERYFAISWPLAKATW